MTGRDSSVFRSGFTIVELLIVVVVIAILAAITIVSYNGITNQAHNSAVQQDLANVAKKIQMAYTESGVFPKGSQLGALGLSVSKGSYSKGFDNATGPNSYFNFLYCWPNTTNPERFALIAQAKSGTTYQWVDGALTVVPGMNGSTAQCASAGVVLPNGGGGRDWLFNDGAWQASMVK